MPCPSSASFEFKPQVAGGDGTASSEEKGKGPLMRYRTITAAVTALAFGGAMAISAPAWADNPPVDTGQGVAVTITNPAAATVTLNQTTLTLNAVTNTDQSSEAPQINVLSGVIQSGIGVDVTSNNGDGYTVQADGPSGGFLSAGEPAMPNADFHLDSPTVNANGSLVHHASTIDSPVTVLSNSGPSGTIWTDNLPPSNDPNRVAGEDQATLAAWVNPNVLVGGKVYQGSIELWYIANA